MSSLRWLRANNTGIDAVPEEIGNLLKLVSTVFIFFVFAYDQGNSKGKETVEWELWKVFTSSEFIFIFAYNKKIQMQ